MLLYAQPSGVMAGVLVSASQDLHTVRLHETDTMLAHLLQQSAPQDRTFMRM